MTCFSSLYFSNIENRRLLATRLLQTPVFLDFSISAHNTQYTLILHVLVGAVNLYYVNIVDGIQFHFLSFVENVFFVQNRSC